MSEQTTISLVLSQLKQRPEMSKQQLEELKRKYSAQAGLQSVVSNKKLITEIKKESGNPASLSRLLVQKLRKSAGRSMSGISVIAVMLPPVSCPYQCAYCPSSSIAAKSYTGYEPAALRARQNDFDAFKQVSARLKQFEDNGHDPQKCELIVMGGTFNTLSIEFQKFFVKRAFDAFNQASSATLEEALRLNENSARRVVAMTIETRPDWAGEEQVRHLMEMGMTRIELGVQSLDDEVLVRVKRGHGVREVVEATQNCKDAFLKVGYHMMPGLFSTTEKDVGMAKRLFEEPGFKPDMLKIYPTLVIPGTELHELWEKGNFQPYDEETAVEAIARIKQFVPEYCRIMRIDRDIPTPQIAAGVKKTNLRELVKRKCVELGINCRCIRCREVGLKQWKQNKKIDLTRAELKKLEYEASGGREVFIDFEIEEEDALVAFLRLRIPSNFEENKVMGVRELRVYGEQVPIGQPAIESAAQHKSFGKKLMQEAEELARERGAEELWVTSGVGVREYYRKRGYERKGVYMAKLL